MQQSYNPVRVISVLCLFIGGLGMSKANILFFFETPESPEDPHKILLEQYKSTHNLIMLTFGVNVQFVWRLRTIIYALPRVDIRPIAIECHLVPQDNVQSSRKMDA